MHRLVALSFLAWLGALPSPSTAATRGHPIVPGFERFYTGEKADAAWGGQLLLTELNCVSCHKPADASLAPKQAPVLDFVATRTRIGYLRKFLRDPQGIKPGTTMPGLFSGDPARDQKVEALLHFLASTGSLRQERPSRKGVAAGRDLYQQVGCVACHGSRDATGNPDKVTATSVPLGDLKAKYSIAGLATFLEDPQHVRPAGRMPKLLAGKEAHDVANYLLQGARVDLASGKGATNYAYYEGSWDRVPDFSKLKPHATGTALGFDVSVARRHDDFALEFKGFLKVEHEAVFTFTVTSDDGSRLYVDGNLVVDNDGIHAPQARQGRARLAKGVHKIRVGFMQGGGGAELDVQIEAAGFGQQNLGDLVAVSEAALERKRPVMNDEDTLDVQPALVAKGRALFASAGCASCHQLSESNRVIASTLSTPLLSKLKGEGGCLSEAPTGLPWYSLSAAQRAALSASIKNPPPRAQTPAALLPRTLMTFNCYACHVRDKVGGAGEVLDKFFLTTQPEMGEEGRVPPPLDGVGAKLTPDYMRHLLDNGVHDRPYMYTRMPGFGVANVGHLIEAFAALDRGEAAVSVSFSDPVSRVKAQARHLSGAQALGCVKCHTFAGSKAEGVQGIDMTLMPKRLRHDWFHAYVADPQRFRPGTRMPSAFVDGKSVLPNILDGKAPTQIEAIWLYLSDPKARPPVGLYSKSIPLEPADGAIIYRNFIEGAGPRAIGVGYPEKAHLAFDANGMRVAMVWKGAFIDAARHWNDRGAGFEGPLGDDVLHLHAGVPFAILSKPEAAWPSAPAKEIGYRFRGYRLTRDDRPTFRYVLGAIEFEDVPNPIVTGKEVSLRRVLTATATKPADNLFYRAAVGNKIEEIGKGWYRVDGTWKLKVDSDMAPKVRQSGGKAELLVPVRFAGGRARIVLEYAW